MKFASFTRGSGSVAVGVVDVERGEVLGLAAAAGRGGRTAPAFFASMLALIDGGDAALEAARELSERWPAEAAFALADVTILAPLPEPRSLRDCLVFEQHLVNVQKQW